MKKYILLILFVVSSGNLFADSDQLRAMWDRANAAYVNGDYSKAIVTYDSIAQMGYSGKKLYYNLGNAWFKNDEIGRAILNYSRALRLDPSDPDIRYNLAVANAHVRDKIETLPEFVVRRWIRAWGLSMSSNGWAVASLVLLAMAFGSVLLYLLAGKIRWRKLGFYFSASFLLLAIIAVVFSADRKRDIVSSSEAVIMSSSASVKSSPDSSSKDLFILHEGTVVRIVGSLGTWDEIMIADGNKGWIRRSSIEII